MMGEAGPAGQFVAGGTDLYPNMKRRQQTPRTVISVGRITELRRIEGDGRERAAHRRGRLLDGDCRAPGRQPRLPFGGARGAAHLDADAEEHGHRRREPAARYALQLLRPELRVAQRHQLLSEEGRRCVLGRAGQLEVLGRAVVRPRAADGGDRRAGPARLDRGRPSGRGARLL